MRSRAMLHLTTYLKYKTRALICGEMEYDEIYVIAGIKGYTNAWMGICLAPAIIHPFKMIHGVFNSRNAFLGNGEIF